MELENNFSLKQNLPNLLFSIFSNFSEACFPKTLSGKVSNMSNPDLGPITITYRITDNSTLGN